MIKKFFFFVTAILMGGMTAVEAKINYVPLYIVDTQPDVKSTRHMPPTQLIMTQDDHKLIFPEFEDSLTFMMLKDGHWVYGEEPMPHQTTVLIPSSFVGDYEVRLYVDTYYYYGYITLEKDSTGDIPTENANWENITFLGSNTSQQVILDSMMGLNVVEYNMKMPDYVKHMSEEDQEAFIKKWNEKQADMCFGLLPEELEAVFPSLVQHHESGEFGINYVDLIPLLVCCIQELKAQLDSRTEKIVDILLSRGSASSAVSDVRSAIGNTLLSVAPTLVSEPAHVRYLLSDNTSNAYIAVTDMGGRVLTRMPVSPSDTSVSIDSNLLGEGIFLCTLFADGKSYGTKRLVKTK